jgi:hypothetical protein
MTLFQALPHDHLSLAKNLTAERKVEEFVAGRGVVVKWERLRRQNHWFDALYNACAAGHFCGVRLVPDGTDAMPARTGTRNLFDGVPWYEEWKERFYAG